MAPDCSKGASQWLNDDVTRAETILVTIINNLPYFFGLKVYFLLSGRPVIMHSVCTIARWRTSDTQVWKILMHFLVKFSTLTSNANIRSGYNFDSVADLEQVFLHLITFYNAFLSSKWSEMKHKLRQSFEMYQALIDDINVSKLTLTLGCQIRFGKCFSIFFLLFRVMIIFWNKCVVKFGAEIWLLDEKVVVTISLIYLLWPAPVVEIKW